MTQPETESPHQKWAFFRYAVVGKLLMNLHQKGSLGRELEKLSEMEWTHPTTGKPIQFAYSTIENWYYQARKQNDPIEALRRKVRDDSGKHKSISLAVKALLREQYQNYPSWSYQLHYDNLCVTAKKTPNIGKVASYWTVFRYMKSNGLIKTKRRRGQRTEGIKRAETRFEKHEVRSYEMDHVNAMWHLDFHEASSQIVTPDGKWVTPVLMGVIDDCSRLLCHAQWYLAENSENLVHGVSQALQKRGLPRMIMMDNGGAMQAGETVQGLKRLGILQEFTLAYSPYQNGKQEVFWAQIEGRLLPMLQNVQNLKLDKLNEATQAWVEMEYNRKKHSSLDCSPVKRFTDVKNVGRSCPGSEILRNHFTLQENRTQRRSDGTITVASIRYEIPSRYRHMESITVRYARWDLSRLFMVDPTHDTKLCSILPLDKSKNADGLRRIRPDSTAEDAIDPMQDRPDAPAPLLEELMAEYAATGLPPAYISKDETSDPENTDSNHHLNEKKHDQ